MRYDDHHFTPGYLYGHVLKGLCVRYPRDRVPCGLRQQGGRSPEPEGGGEAHGFTGGLHRQGAAATDPCRPGDQLGFFLCALGLHQCDAAKPCPLHDHFLGIREDLRRMLERTSVHDLMSGLRDGDTFLKR